MHRKAPRLQHHRLDAEADARRATLITIAVVLLIVLALGYLFGRAA
jgi:hypothetical protein